MAHQQITNPQYDTFSATRSHYHSNGLVMMPSSGPFPSAAGVVSLNGGLDLDCIVYTATRRGEPPVVPSPLISNPNRVFLRGGRIAEWPIVDFSGTIGYGLSGWMLFGLLVPEALNSEFMIGSMPFPGVPANQSIPGKYFQYALINQNLTQTMIPVPQMDSPLMSMIAAG